MLNPDIQHMKDIDVIYDTESENKIIIQKGFKENTYRNAAVVLISRGKTLLLKNSYSDRKFATPGGHIDKGEGALEAAFRELWEETTIEIDVSDILDFKTFVYNPTNTKIFIVEIDKRPNVKLSSEHTRYVWSDIDKVFEEDLTDYARGAFKIMIDKKLLT